MKRLSKNIVSLASADIISRLLGFVAVAYLARTLGPANMGIIAVGMAILAYGTIFADAGLPILSTRTVATGKTEFKALVRKIWSARLLLSILVLVIGTFLLTSFLKDVETRKVTIVYLVALLPAAFFLDWLFQGISDMGTLAKGRIVGMAVYLAFVLLLVSTTSDLTWVPISWVGGTVAQAFFLWFSYKKLPKEKSYNELNPPGIFKLIQDGIPLGVATLISQVVIQFPLIYIGLFDKAENAGLYSVAFRVIVFLLVVDRVFYTIFFPIISRSFKEGVTFLRQRVERTLKLVSAGVLYLSILSILAGDYIFSPIFGAEFERSSVIFQTLIAYFVLTVINSIFTFTLIGVEREKAYTRSLFIGAVGFFAVMLLPIPLPSTLLAPIALTLFQAISLLVMSRELQDIIPMALFGRILLPILTAAFLIILFSILGNNHPILAILVALVLSPPILAWSAGIHRNDLDFLKRVLV